MLSHSHVGSPEDSRRAARARHRGVAKTTVSKYMGRKPKSPSQSWRAFVDNHIKQLVSIDFLVVPTIGFRLMFVFLVLAHERRRVIHFNITEHPSAAWTAQQIRQAFSWDTAPRYLVRDRDFVYGETFRRQVSSLEISEVLTAPQSPWQSPYVERTDSKRLPQSCNCTGREITRPYASLVYRVLSQFPLSSRT